MRDNSAFGGEGPQATGPRSVAAGGGVGVAITGDGAQVVMLPAEAVRWAQEVEAPPGAGNLPGSASGLFVGRQNELAKLRRLLADEGEAAVTQVSGTRAIHGLGGIGKSTLALHYAHTHRRNYTLMWWINAASTEQIVTSLATLATRLCPQWAASTGVQERAAWAILWLQWHPGWLLIFDSVEDPADLHHYLGTLPDGHHLATSRTATGWHAIAPTMPLDLLDAEAAVTLLCTLALGQERTATREQRQDSAALAAELGYLPLALEQAGAYLFETGTSLTDYRLMLGQVIDTAAGGIDPERTIARIWRHTLTAIERRNPQAVTLLNVMAWLAPDAIPRTLLAPLCPNVLTLGEALGALHSYNMISYSADRETISVHRLLQTVLRHRPATDSDGYPPGRRDAEYAVAQALAEADVGTPHQEGQWEQLLPQVLALAESAPAQMMTSPGVITTCYYTAAEYLRHQGRPSLAIPILSQALLQSEQVFGDTHPNTWILRNNLATACKDAGDFQRAIKLLEAAITHCEQFPDKSDPQLFAFRSNLASAYLDSGEAQKAVPVLQALLSSAEKAFGATHPQTLIFRNNLASAHREAGNYLESIRLSRALLVQAEQVLGDDHPNTLTFYNNLATLYQTLGDLQCAIALFETTLTRRKHVLSNSHPDTLSSYNNLACAYMETGSFNQAVDLMEVAFAQYEKILGDNHPSTLIARNNLTRARRYAQ